MNKLISILFLCIVSVTVIVSDTVVRDATARADQRSLLVIFDCTTSMGRDLAQLKNAAKDIINEFSKRKNNPIFNYILVEFRDPEIEPALVNTDPQMILQKLDQIVLSGPKNFDCPEMAIGGLKEGIKHALDNSIAFVISDASAKDHAEYRSTLNILQKKQISVTFLSTGNCGERNGDGFKVYEKLARYSNGQLFDMKSEGIREVILAIRLQLNDEFTSLESVDSITAGTTNKEFSVDSTLSEIQISLAGSNPIMVIKNPLGQIVIGELTSMDNLKIVKILNPMPGRWTVEAKSSSAHSIRFGAISNAKISFGFGGEPATKAAETSKSPAKGVPNTMTFFVPDSTGINITHVNIEELIDERFG